MRLRKRSDSDHRITQPSIEKITNGMVRRGWVKQIILYFALFESFSDFVATVKYVSLRRGFYRRVAIN